MKTIKGKAFLAFFAGVFALTVFAPVFSQQSNYWMNLYNSVLQGKTPIERLTPQQVVMLSKIHNTLHPTGTSGAIESAIDGDYEGWDDDKVYKLQNGQIWQQASYHYHYHYAYSPKVLIYQGSGCTKMKVDGDDDDPVCVKRLN